MANAGEDDEKDLEDWLGIVCGALSTLILIPTGMDHMQKIMEFFQHEAFQRKLYEMINKTNSEGEIEEHHNHYPILLCLSQYFGILKQTNSQQSALGKTEFENVLAKLSEVIKSMDESLNKTALLSNDLIIMHEEDESDLFFEVALTEEPQNALRHLARKRIINSWAQREEEVIKSVYQTLM